MTLFEYIHDLWAALFRAHGKSGDDEEYDDDVDDTDDALDPSFILQDDYEDGIHDTTLYLPGQGVGQKQDSYPDSTGLPQGCDSITHAGAGPVTAQTGGFPG